MLEKVTFFLQRIQIYFFFLGGGGGARVSVFFPKYPNLKREKNFFFWGGGGGEKVVFFFTKNPNLIFFLGGGEGGWGKWEARVSDFFY